MTTEDILHDWIYRLAWRILLAHEVIGRLAERRDPPILTETDYPLE